MNDMDTRQAFSRSQTTALSAPHANGEPTACYGSSVTSPDEEQVSGTSIETSRWQKRSKSPSRETPVIPGEGD